MSKPTGAVPKVKKRPNPSAPNNEEHHQLLWPPVAVNNLQSTEWPSTRQQTNGQLQRDLSSSGPIDFADQFAAAFMTTDSNSSRARQSTPLLSVQPSHPFARGRDHQSPADLDMEARTNGVDHQRFSEGSANALLDATKNNFSRIPDRNQVLSRLNQIRDYVKQTSALMDSLNGSTDLALTNGNLSPQSFNGGAIPKVRDQNQLVVNQQQTRRRQSGQSSSEERSPGPTAVQYAKHQELKLKVEESQKKLQALVQHQAALISLQEKAQQQLNDPKAFSQEFLRNWSDGTDSLTRQFQDFSTNDMVSLLGDQDKELDAEYMAIQERLQEIHDRKRTVDRLNRDMQALQPSLRDNHDVSSSDEEEEEVVVSNGRATYLEVESKVDELNSMKARLANLQSLVTAINRGEMPMDSIKSALAANEGEQRRDSSRSSSSKPDNNRNSDTHPKSIDEQSYQIQLKAQQLDQAKQKLQQLKDLLSAAGIADDDMDGEESVNSFSSAGRPVEPQIPSQELEQLMRIYIPQAMPESVSPAVPQRKAKNVKQDPVIAAVHDPTGRSQRAFMQAKRQELEEMMRKDQGQSSINQDTCNASGLSLSDAGATWGGSMMSAVPSHSEQQNSINCSSEELTWESELLGQNPAMPIPRLQSVGPSAFRQVRQNTQKSPAGNKPAIWSEPPIESSTPIYDIPPRSSSSNATPRPLGDDAPPHAQWWLLQQQVEASNAACQSMMQQWQWGAPSPENWWPASPAVPHMMTTLSQCCQMLWMQQREIMNLHATLQTMQDRMVCNEQNLSANFVPPFNNSGDAPTTVTGAHSLPNLCEDPPVPPHFMLPGAAHFPWPSAQTPNNASVLPPMIRHGPPVTLNNQVPPGVRANNYWDNFRSYSRQNLLSTNTKVNEGQMQHPNPLTDRSHNSLRSNDEAQQHHSPSRFIPQMQRKQKLNSERHPVHQQSHLVPPQSHNGGSNSPAEQLFSELASLVAQNQSRPDFLPQLFRELKTLRCNSDCQRVLSSIREIGARDEMMSLEEPSTSNIRSETPEGAASLPLTKSPQRGQASDNQVDTKIQSLLLQLMPFLKNRREDCCTPALLEMIIQRTLGHLTMAQQPALNSFVQGQLNGRLEEALSKFQGCWLRDVGEELLATVAEVLLKELAFFKLLENVTQSDQASSTVLLTSNQTDSLQTNISETLSPDDPMDSSDSELGAAGVPPTPPQRNCWLPPCMREAAKAALEARAEVIDVELCDGDLAEADQSHEIAESEGRSSQAEGATASDVPVLETPNEQLASAPEEVWQVEQDRELDQVPSRLEPGEVSQPQGSAPTQP